ncbi:MAG: 23S rRNA (guanosine(2251)-2'-O)-methyltransferase RlmB [candidate division WOR-3 bacterium]
MKTRAGKFYNFLVIIYGINPVLEYLRGTGQKPQRILVSEGRSLPSELRSAIEAAGLRLENVPRGRLDRLTGTKKHQGIVAIIPPIEYMPPEEFLGLLVEKRGVGLILHDIEDPGNIGAIIRTAEFLGAVGVAISGAHTPGVTDVSVKSSAGAVFHLPVCRLGNPKVFIKEFRAVGGWVAGVELGGQDIVLADPPLPIVLVLGSEGRGLPEKLREKCDFILTISGRGKTGSLNVSVAGAIALWALLSKNSSLGSH